MDARRENRMKNVPTLIERVEGWELEGFEPLSPAYNYPDICQKKAFIYGFHCDGFIKIGRSQDPEKRRQHISREWKGPPLELVAAEEVPYAGSVYAERLMHLEFIEKELKREWFDLSPANFLEFLPYAVIGAKAYDAACRDWHAARHQN